MLAVSAPTSSNKIDGRDHHHHHHHHLHRGGMEIEISSNGTANDIIMDVIDASNCNTSFTLDDFPEFSVGGGNLLDSIDFDDLFTGISDEGDEMLPGLETDPHELLLSEFSVPEDDSFSNYESMPSFKVEVEDKQQQQQQVVIGDEGSRYYEEGNNSSNSSINYDENNLDVMMNYSVSENENGKNDNNNNLDVSGSGSDNKVVESKGEVVTGKDEEIESKKMEELPVSSSTSRRRESSDKAAGKKWSSKSSSNNNNNKDQGKRKTKVDWTPDLHRRFVQAVEQLGVDKAVPSRILELMGIDCLTRHNIASHLQKYRSHRKHLLAREAEAARWTQKRQIYNGAPPPPPAIVPVPPPPPVVSGGKITAGSNHHVYHHHHNPWNSPTMGFPPPLTRPTMHHNHHHPPPPFLPLHVWGHPTHHMEAANGNHRHHQQQPAMMPIWPKHIVAAPPPPHGAVPWAKHLTPPPTVAWHSHPQRVPNALPPCFPQPPSATHHSFGAVQPVPGVPPPPHPIMYSNKPDPAPAANPPNLDFHPTKESIDAAIGDVISKPWLPLPLGLKPPSVDSVLVELQRQGIPKIPPSSSTTST